MQFGHWYDDPGIIACLDRQTLVREICMRVPRKPTDRIAFCRGGGVYQRFNFRAYGSSDAFLKCGAPVDQIHIDDLIDDPSPYRVVFMAVPALTRAQRKKFKRRVAQDGRLIIFLPGTGAVCPDCDVPLDLGHITDLTGMRMKVKRRRKDRIVFTAEGARRLRFVKKGERLSDKYTRASIYPADRSVTVLGQFKDGGAAVAYKKRRGHTVIYVAAVRLSTAFVASLAGMQGVHLYAEPGNVLSANRSLVLYHTARAGRHTVRFPRRVDVYDLYAGKWVGRNTDRVTETLAFGRTRFYLIGKKAELEKAIHAGTRAFQERRKK